MAKFTDGIGGMKTGDLVFVRYPPRGTQPIHVTVFLEPAFGHGEAYVHAGDKELEIAARASYAEYAPYGGYLHASTTNTDLRQGVAHVAALFAHGTAKATPYGHYPNKDDVLRITGGQAVASPRANRFGGMIGTRTVAEIPFQFPALHRLLKWTLRAMDKSALSEKRGITCAAFSAACHQVAGMLAFFEETGLRYTPDVVRGCVRELDRLVVSKQDLRAALDVIGVDDRTGKTVYKGQALPAHSNRTLTPAGTAQLKGLTERESTQTPGKMVKQEWLREWEKLGTTFAQLSGIERLWLIVQMQMLGLPAVSVKPLSSIIDPAFFFDAKYVSSPALAAALVAAGSWRTVEYTDY